jgi:flagellar FliJ protein
MRKFRFPLEGVARVRELAVRRREVDLAQAHEALARAEEARRRSEEELRRSLRSAPQGTVVQVRQLLEQDRALRRLRSRLQSEHETLDSSAAGVDRQRGLLLEAKREAEAVDKLRARRYQEFLREVLREEQKATDEVASRRMREKRAA